MIDKFLLNKQIVTNKNKIQEGRIQVVRKTVQKIKTIKLLNEKNPQNAKITKKLEKFLKIIDCLKKLKDADIIVKILTLQEKPAAIITNGEATPGDTAIALLASNKILVGIVETLRSLLTLDDTNPGWQNEILELSKRQKKILGSEKRKKLKKTKPDKKQLKVKLQPRKEENIEKQETQDDARIDDVPLRTGKEEPTSETILTQSLSENLVKSKQKKVKSALPAEKLNNHKEPAKSKPLTTVDSFFFTETGDSYLSTAVIERVQAEPTQDGFVRRQRRDHTLRPNKENNKFRKQSLSDADGFYSKRQSIQSGRIDKRQNFGSKTNTYSESVLANEEKLHPSWAAKQKLKPIITEFKGNKIAFDCDGNDMTVKSFNTRNKSIYQEDKSVVSSLEDLHPSWVAKQKLKPTIAEFKGNKITFDNDGNETAIQSFNKRNKSTNHEDKSIVSSQEALHPSWAAKQKLKPTIAEFKGNKITFDNDGNEAAIQSFNTRNKSANYKDKSNDSSQEALHPSWAAKLKQKPAITEFKGTKISFDN